MVGAGLRQVIFRLVASVSMEKEQEFSSGNGFGDNGRLVALVIFEHARENWADIYKNITETPDLEVRHVRRHQFRSSRALISALYAHDYAPLDHLKTKTNYLKKTGTETLVLFCLQRRSSLFIAGTGSFSHLEDRICNQLKWEIRHRYNPRNSVGDMTHNHVIHATDNPDQVHHLAKQLYDAPINSIMAHHGPGRILPHHLSGSSLRIRQVSVDQLRVRILPDHQVFRVEDTPHFAALANNDPERYWRYLIPYLGKELRDGHSWNRFTALKSRIDSDAPQAPIVVAPRYNRQYLVHDGAHRAAILVHAGQQECLVAVIHGQSRN